MVPPSPCLKLQSVYLDTEIQSYLEICGILKVLECLGYSEYVEYLNYLNPLQGLYPLQSLDPLQSFDHLLEAARLGKGNPGTRFGPGDANIRSGLGFRV